MNDRFLETTWDHLLSRDPSLVRLAYASLDEESQQVVLEHLRVMTSEPGWHPEQAASAQAALAAIRE
jgi:hypothetical protein